MATSNLNETTFEEHIAQQLAGSDLYNQRTSRDFDIEHLCDREMLERFLRQQPAVWAMLEHAFPGQETDEVVKQLNSQLNRGESMLKIFRKGFKIRGKTSSLPNSNLFSPGRTVRLIGSIGPTLSASCARCAIAQPAATRATNLICASCSTVCRSSPSS